MDLEELTAHRDALVRESTEIHARARAKHRNLTTGEQIRDREIDEELAEIKRQMNEIKKSQPRSAFDLRVEAANDNLKLRLPGPRQT